MPDSTEKQAAVNPQEQPVEECRRRLQLPMMLPAT